MVHGTCLLGATTLAAPLERIRIIQQTSTMQNFRTGQMPTGAGTLASLILKDQGVSAFWRGNMPLVYRQFVNLFMRVTLYDKFKNMWMPYNPSKYSGFDYFWRASLSGLMCMGFTTFVTYPLDLIHTRTTADMTAKGKTRLFNTTFDCFNRTNLDEGRAGLYKGVEFALVSGVLKGMLTLPLYDLFKKTRDETQPATGFRYFFDRVGCSLASGLMLSLLVYPLDTAKRCMQMNGGRGSLSLYTNSLDCAGKIRKQLGMAGLYKGAGLFCASQVLVSFAQFSLYDMFDQKKFRID